MLLQIREYLRREKVASTQQLVRVFGMDLPALQPLLDTWVRKGVFVCCQENTACKTRCFKCKTPPVYYQYVG